MDTLDAVRGEPVRIFDAVDTFNLRPQPKHLAAARPCERKLLLRYAGRYLRHCESAGSTLPAFRRWND